MTEHRPPVIHLLRNLLIGPGGLRSFATALCPIRLKASAAVTEHRPPVIRLLRNLLIGPGGLRSVATALCPIRLKASAAVTEHRSPVIRLNFNLTPITFVSLDGTDYTTTYPSGSV